MRSEAGGDWTITEFRKTAIVDGLIGLSFSPVSLMVLINFEAVDNCNALVETFGQQALLPTKLNCDVGFCDN